MIQSIVWLDKGEAHNLYVNGNHTVNGYKTMPLGAVRPTTATGFVVTVAAVAEAQRLGRLGDDLQQEILRSYHQLIVQNGFYQPFVQVSVSPIHAGMVDLTEADTQLGSESVLQRISEMVAADRDDSPFSVLVQSYQAPLQLRAYTALEREPCLAIFRSNLQGFFAHEEEAEFAIFLNDPQCSYFVAEWEEEIVGCGGFWLDREAESAGLVWGMVRNNQQQKGIGRYLLLARLQTIGLQTPNATVKLDTSQHTYPFYAKFGFKTQKVTENYYSPGLHRYDMSLHLDQTRRRWIAELLAKRNYSGSEKKLGF